MKCERLENLDRQEMRDAMGGLAFVQYQTVNSLVNYDWLKIAAAKLRANLQVLPPIGPIGPIPRG